MKSLYKKDSKGKIRVWNIYTVGPDIIQTSGLLEGECVKHIKTCKAKNVGKSNETTPIEQAVLEMTSNYDGKFSEGYFKTIKEANEEEVILPMLAKSYDDHSKKIDWKSSFVQPKLDGMRCLSTVIDGEVLLKSRDGKIIKGLDHIVEELCKLPDGIYDGELYAHGVGFQENMRLIKKYRAGQTETVKYCIYDMIVDGAFSTRFTFLQKSLQRLSVYKHLEVVNTAVVENEKSLQSYHKKYLADGYEGSIVRWGHEEYKVNGRSAHLLKYKDFQDMAIKINDVKPSEQRPEWGQFVFTHKGHEFSCGMKFSHDERKEILNNKKEYIGKTAELRYFELSEDGVPRFPVCVGIRLDK